VITLTDENADNGGFTITTLASSGAFGGSGASAAGAAVSATADLITDFLSGTDKIDLDLPAGVENINYIEAAQATDYATALAAANLALNQTVRYYLTSLSDDPDNGGATSATGLLFFDVNMDGNVDGVIKLTGISSANFAATDIIA
jgi:hypothetical protein